MATLFCLLVVAPRLASALTLTPTSREVNLTPGQKTVSTIQLKNETQKSTQLTTEVVEFTAKGETGEPQFDFNAQPSGIVTWIQVEKGPITLAAGETKSVDVIFNTPADATPGGHYAAVFFNEVITGQGAGQVNIESKLGTLFLATVKGTYAEKGAITTFATTGEETLYTKGPIDFMLRFHNTGSVHLKPTGSVKITNMFGKTVATIPVNQDLGATLPGTIRNYQVDSWNSIGNLYGQYTATLTLTAGQMTATAVTKFWAVSLVWLLVMIAVIIVLAVFLLMLVRRVVVKSTPPTP